MSVDPQGLEAKLALAWPPARWSDVTVLVAVSGGADSVALLRALNRLKAAGAGRLVVAHFNHRWRGAASDADEQFVRVLAGQLGLDAVIERAETPPIAASEASGGPRNEETARHARYAFFLRAAHRLGARYVALGHTADDQVETVVHHLFRGTGLAGLAGMPRVRPLDEATTLVRPLLDVWREEVIRYLQQCGQPFQEDATNRELGFRRNWLRHQLLPQVEQQYGRHVRQAILRLADIARQTDQYLRQQAEGWLQQVARPVPGGVELRDDPAIAPVVLHAAFSLLWERQGWPLQELSYEKWNQLIAMLRQPGKGQPTACDLPGGVHARRVAEGLRLTRDADPP